MCRPIKKIEILDLIQKNEIYFFQVLLSLKNQGEVRKFKKNVFRAETKMRKSINFASGDE